MEQSGGQYDIAIIYFLFDIRVEPEEECKSTVGLSWVSDIFRINNRQNICRFGVSIQLNRFPC